MYLKNCINRRWTIESNAAGAIEDAEKNDLRQRLVPIIVSSPITTRPQLANVLNNVLGHDFPEQWPSFLDDTISMLASANVESVYAGLLCLLELARVYRWRSKDRRKDLDTIIRASFPILLQVGGGVLDEDSSLAGDMMRMILKIYKCIIWLELSTELQQMSSLVPWGQLLLKVIAKPPSAESMAGSVEEREQHAWWKAKKWAYFSLDRLFQRYGDSTQLSAEYVKEYQSFAKVFTTQFAPEILKCYLGQVQNWAADPKTNWLSSRSLYYIGSFLTSCVRPKTTWSLLKDNFDSLAEHFVFPQICQTQDDLDLWVEDPQEYINKRIDVYDDYTSPDVAATNFLVACCARKKTSCFMHTLEFVNRELIHYQQAPLDQKNPIRKEAALRMIGSLSHMILNDKCEIKPMMEEFFAAHVLPELTSPHGYLRARACEMLNRFAEIDFENQNNMAITYDGVMKCLTEQELPVRVEAALALQPLIRQDFIHTAMVQSIPKIMRTLLQLANEVDVDSLSNVMEEFVEVFANELTPYAVELAEQLRDTFMRIMQDTVEQGISDDGFEWNAMDDKSLAALGILNTIGTLILSLENTPEALFKLEDTVMPVIEFVLNYEIIDLYAEAFEIIDACTFSAKTISPSMWKLFEQLYATFKSSGMDYMDELLPPLLNYVSFGAEAIAATPKYQSHIFDIVSSVFTSDRLGVQDRLAATKLAQMYLLNLKGHIDQYLHPLMSLTLARIWDPKEPRVKSYKTLLLETVVNCVYYNPVAALSFLESSGTTTQFLTLWLTSLESFVRVHDKKLIILTMLSLLSLSPEQVPESARSGWSQISDALLQVFSTLPAAIERRNKAQHTLISGEDEWGNDDDGDDGIDVADEADDDDWEGEVDGDAPDPDPAAQAYLDFLSKESGRISSSANGEDDFFEDDDDEMAEDVLFVSPLDNIDAYIAAKSFFQGLHNTNPQAYNSFTSHWDQDKQAQFQSIMTIATSNETLNAAKSTMA